MERKEDCYCETTAVDMLKKYLPKAAVQSGVVLSNLDCSNKSFDCPTHPLFTPNTFALDSDYFALNIASTSSSAIRR